MAVCGMRGLSVFISDVRNCQSKGQDRLRVDKELGNIRTRFRNDKLQWDSFVVNSWEYDYTSHTIFEFS